jgi:hypothetical protein
MTKDETVKSVAMYFVRQGKFGVRQAILTFGMALAVIH